MNITSPAQYYQATYATNFDTRNSPQTTVLVDNHLMVNASGSAVNSRVGTSNPRWRDQVLKHIEAGTPYSMKAWKITPAILVGRSETLKTGFTAGYSSSGFSRNRMVIGNVILPSSTSASLQNIAISRLKNNLRDQTGSANVLAPLAESRELHGLIHQFSAFTYKFLQSLVELRKGRTRRAANLMQDSWLAWNFGTSPLIHDINEAGKAIASFIARNDASYRIKGSARQRGIGSYEPSNNVFAPLGCEYVVKGEYRYDLSYRYIGSFSSKIRSANDYTVFDHLGIRLDQLPATLWELTAFSWMADYFANIGDFLQDVFYCPPGNTNYLNLTRMFRAWFEHSGTLRVIPGNPSNVRIVQDTSSKSYVEYTEMDRSVLGVLPHVGLSFKTLSQIGSNPIPKLLNLVSVLKVNPYGPRLERVGRSGPVFTGWERIIPIRSH